MWPEAPRACHAICAVDIHLKQLYGLSQSIVLSIIGNPIRPIEQSGNSGQTVNLVPG